MVVANGLVSVVAVGHLWEVEGRDDSGHKVEMKVDARSGEIVKMRRND